MTQLNRLSACLAATLLLALAVCPPALSADEGEEKELGWSDSAELSYVLTAGNSETTSLGFKNTLKRTWERALFSSRIAAIRAEARDPLTAIGVPLDYSLVERTQKTAETYFIDGRYDRKITDRFFWYALASWFRNQPAGIQDRYVGAAGVGNIWYESEGLKFSTDYGATITKQEDVIPVPGVDDTFPGLRFHWYYLNQWGKNTTYENELYLDLNVDETSDWRGSNDNSLTVAMSERLGIKLGLTFLYQNEPALGLIPLTDADGVLTGETVVVPLDKLDTIFTTALVMNF